MKPTVSQNDLTEVKINTFRFESMLTINGQAIADELLTVDSQSTKKDTIGIVFVMTTLWQSVRLSQS